MKATGPVRVLIEESNWILSEFSSLLRFQCERL